MRVSTYGAYQSGLQAMQRLQQALDSTQRQISSGRRLQNPSDDPIAAARALDISEAISRLGQFDRNANIVSNRLGQEEAALNAVNNTLQRVRELALQANNATQNNESRRQIAVELREHLDNIVQLANQQDGNGGYLFAGNLEDTQPVVRSGSTYNYNGDQGQRQIQIGEGRRVADSDPGSSVFFEIRDGNGTFSISADAANSGTGLIGVGSVVDPTQYDRDTYTVRMLAGDTYEVVDSSAAVVATGAFLSGDTIAFRGIEFSISGSPAVGDEFLVAPSANKDVFSMIEELAVALERPVTSDAGRTELNNTVNGVLLDIDQAIGNVLEVRTQVGARLAGISDQVDSNGGQVLTLQTTLAEIRDLDYAAAISQLSIEAATLEAAQASFLRTQQLSLFNFF